MSDAACVVVAEEAGRLVYVNLRTEHSHTHPNVQTYCMLAKRKKKKKNLHTHCISANSPTSKPFSHVTPTQTAKWYSYFNVGKRDGGVSWKRNCCFVHTFDAWKEC